MKTTYLKRSDLQVDAALRAQANLAAAGLKFFPLKSRSKVPRDAGWAHADYSLLDWRELISKWGNVGVRLTQGQLVVDVDPRNGGTESCDWLKTVTGVDLGAYPTVVTGGGGTHHYMALNVAGPLRHVLKDFPGIDFQSWGRYVVAPGSIHPDTGRVYRRKARFPGVLPPAPTALVQLLQRPPRAGRQTQGGSLTRAQLTVMLSALNPCDYGQGGTMHHRWLDIAMASHHGTNGEGLNEWLDWCSDDSRYGTDATAANTLRWESFDMDRSGGVTVRTLFKAVVDAGRADLVAAVKVGAADDFADEDADLLVYDAIDDEEG